MPKNSPITGKIAGFVTKKNVVINRGSEDGVKEGMRFSVNLSIGRIEDPDDPSNTLEGLSFVKARIRATSVYKRMSYCSIIGTRSGQINPLQRSLFSNMVKFDYPEIDDNTVVSDDAWKLRRGDPIKEIVEDNEKEDER